LTEFPRRSGVLLHITSLPGPYGIGEIGPHAYAFIDLLQEMGQSLWQILPVIDTGNHKSPYTTISAFANNPLLISFNLLVDDKLLEDSELEALPNFTDDRVDFDSVVPARSAVLDTVCEMFDKRATKKQKSAYNLFCKKNAYWLEDYALFTALKDAHDGAVWTDWDPEYAHCKDGAMKSARLEYKESIQRQKIVQYLFDDQWNRLRAYAHSQGIRIVGDIPIYVSHDSADVWVNQELFQLDEDGIMIVQSGCPPDYFCATGQLWGNPIYSWDAHDKSGYRWWTNRLQKLYDMVDIVRIDHFNGFVKYWEVPIESKSAQNGKWVTGPGEKIFDTLFRELGKKPIIAEDLGEAAKDATVLREKYHLPGMKILQFAFDPHELRDGCLPHQYPRNCVVYTGTHDNDTTRGWFHAEPGNAVTRTLAEIREERATVLSYLGNDESEINWDMIQMALQSNAHTSIIPLQDILGLDSEARMNIPGTVEGNWIWRFKRNLLSDGAIERMCNLTQQSERMN